MLSYQNKQIETYLLNYGIGGGLVGGIGGGLSAANAEKNKLQERAAKAQSEAINKLQESTASQVGIQSIQKTATALKDKNVVKRTISSLRIGLNTGDTSSGINIPT